VSRKPAPEMPRLLLATGSLRQPSRVPRDRMLEVAARYREPESLAVTLSKAMDAGAEGVLATPSTALANALFELGKTVPLFAVLPDLPESGRHDLEPEAFDLLGRERRAAAGGVRVAWMRFVNAVPLARGDFYARVRLALEEEAAAIPRRALRGIVLSSAITDQAAVAGNRRFFERLLRAVRRRFHVPAALETMNLGFLLARLREWELAPDFVIGPMNPCGVMMKPSPDAVLAEMKQAGVKVIARELRASGLCTLEDGARYARAHGAWGLAPDLSEVDEVAGELARLAGKTLPPVVPLRPVPASSAAAASA